MKYWLIWMAVFSFTISSSQETKKKISDTTYWSISGKNKILFNQSAFSNWVARGENTVAGNVAVDYVFNYKRNKWVWNNRVITSYGLTKIKSTEFVKKTDDVINLHTLLGYKAEKNWFYSILVNFKTQYTKGYKYGKDGDGNQIRSEYTKFLSPGYLLIGPGMLWEKNANLKLNIAPATSKFVFVDADFTLPNNAYFGVKEGENLRYELGFNASFLYKFKLMENITMENMSALYSNYLEDPWNIDINYTMIIAMKVNKIFTSNLIFQAIYDDNAYQGFQIREVFGIGLNYEVKNK